jgi:hypothetical protein
MRPGLITSINAAYLTVEIETMLANTKLEGWHVKNNMLGIVITGQKLA